MKFSQRIRLVPATKTLQIESMSPELRNSLWNLLYLNIWSKISLKLGDPYAERDAFIEKLSLKYYKEPLDRLPISRRERLDITRSRFFNCKWFEVYEFIEEILNGNYFTYHKQTC